MKHSSSPDAIAGFEVDLKQALIWVARALDYVGVDDTHHSHRVAYIAYQCALALNWDLKKAEFCYFAGMIHDCGVSETQEHKMLLDELIPQDAKAHCLRGYQTLKQCRLLSQFAVPVLYHHTHWDELQHLDLPEFEKDVAALLYLSDRLDFMRARYVMNCHCDIVTLHEKLIAECVLANAGTLFNPVMCEAMVKLIMTDGFWFAMESENIETIGLNFKSIDWLQKQLTIWDMNSLGLFLARIVDAKSPFTYQHSQKVAELSRYLAGKLGLDEHDQEMLFIAGLVHDIGKLKTPDEILHKEGALSKQEYTRIKRHTIDTQLALHKVFPNAKIAEWASNHHERLDGSGYPYHKTAEELDIPSRIIAVADVFQALSQDRPYRGRMSQTQIVEIMDDLIEQNKLCAHVYEVLEQNMTACYNISICH
ncbi:HD-GYP domain-containing protein [Vibrio parahaemolyticus]|uniref:HD-GYP domain-containing protein n=1 Tax=Vibrio parahaemolyticus TaxID=670 RepID=UPI00038E7059|nr:HD-GYP domain-containing protein [Vibrio parahaemolyticus]EGR0921345.1 HD-GYP domain-containing protein [Vibrio parahaemolyticus]EGR0987776.1 HD-GYP domain-containing protein [Vibrio parahaemolyticus]EGR1370206.1 HD-GYP domain-containing protein [Vibrio parahaemolyticus]EGR1949509.1 HD-GYP domain-containing protein [Vibrio parahaemolyticus]EGR3362309.1 HD-GYP domain-containing protein [Vibrio parahaemolyticus]